MGYTSIGVCICSVSLSTSISLFAWLDSCAYIYIFADDYTYSYVRNAPALLIHVVAQKDTLSKCTYFLPYLECRMDHAVDEDDGSFFVDRSGQFFGHLLQFMRTSLCPNCSYVARNKQGLLSECEYFGLDHVAHRIRGETSPYDMRPKDRCSKQQEADAGSLLDVFESCLLYTSPSPRDLSTSRMPSSA